MVTDHVNGDRLDNRRDNLRAVTQRQNTTNRTKMPRKHGAAMGLPRHVYFSNKLIKPFMVRVRESSGRHVYYGSYATIEEAAVVAAAKRLQNGYIGGQEDPIPSLAK